MRGSLGSRGSRRKGPGSGNGKGEQRGKEKRASLDRQSL